MCMPQKVEDPGDTVNGWTEALGSGERPGTGPDAAPEGPNQIDTVDNRPLKKRLRPHRARQNESKVSGSPAPPLSAKCLTLKKGRKKFCGKEAGSRG